jgi:PLP dependent protein
MTCQFQSPCIFVAMSIRKNAQILLQRLNVACEQHGRDLSDMRVLLATKEQSPETIREAVAAGLHLMGENKVQELVPKAKALRDVEIVWHFIGHLQSNKVKDCIEIVDTVQSVDRESLIKELQKHCVRVNRHLNVYVEVNTSGEASKHGCTPKEVNKLLDLIGDANRLHVRGFMTMGALSTDERTVRAGFAMLREIRDKAISEGRIPESAFELSMGMSSDLEWAVAEGSTMIRVGSAIFGDGSG